MADIVFVDPVTGLPLGDHAYGTIAAGTASASFEFDCRYRWGQSGAGHYQSAFVLEVSDDGGATWRTDLTEFTLQATAALNPGNDPEFYGAPTAAQRTTRLEVAPFRAGTGYTGELVFSPSLRTGTARTTYQWKLGVLYNENFRAISVIPDAPTGVLTGIGDVTVSEWVNVPSLTLGTDEVTLGTGDYVHEGVAVTAVDGAVALNQTSSTGALTSGQEYWALLSHGASGAATVTKGARATAGSAVAPSYPAGELPYAAVRVPYGGVIATVTVVAVAGRLSLSDGGGLVVVAQPGRATMPGYLLTPRTVQSITVPNSATTPIYLGPQGTLVTTGGVYLGTATAAGGVLTDLTYEPVLLYGGRPAKLISDLDVNSHRITGIPLATAGVTPEDEVSTWGSVMGRSVKGSCRLAATTPVTWPNVVTNGDFTTDLTGWTGTNWAQSAGTALHTAGATDPLAFALTVVDAVRHRITVTVTGAAGTVTPMVGADAGTPIAAGAGTVTQEILSTAGGALSVSFVPTTDFDGALDDILVETLLYGLCDPVDSETVANEDRLLLAGETDYTLAGKWICYAAGPWVRHPDCLDNYFVYPGISLWVTEGAAELKSEWVMHGTWAAQEWAKKYQVP